MIAIQIGLPAVPSPLLESHRLVSGIFSELGVGVRSALSVLVNTHTATHAWHRKDAFPHVTPARTADPQPGSPTVKGFVTLERVEKSACAGITPAPAVSHCL
jgi:hypothetical protein